MTNGERQRKISTKSARFAADNNSSNTATRREPVHMQRAKSTTMLDEYRMNETQQNQVMNGQQTNNISTINTNKTTISINSKKQRIQQQQQNLQQLQLQKQQLELQLKQEHQQNQQQQLQQQIKKLKEYYYEMQQQKHHQQQQQQQSYSKTQTSLHSHNSIENNGLNIINGSHVHQHKQQPSRVTKKTHAYTQLSRPKPVQMLPNPKPIVPKVVYERPNYQSIKVQAKGGDISLIYEKEQDHIQVSDTMKRRIASNMYSHNTQYQHDFQDYVDIGEDDDEQSEVVYYTVCTHYFKPENYDWILNIHRMGEARVPISRRHHDRCVFWNDFVNPDQEEIVVQKLIPNNISLQSASTVASYEQQANGNSGSAHSASYVQKPERVVSSNSQMHSATSVQKQMQISDHELRQQQMRLSSANQQHHRAQQSWADRAFNDTNDSLANYEAKHQHQATHQRHRQETSGGLLHDSMESNSYLDTAFDARSIASDTSNRSFTSGNIFQKPTDNDNENTIRHDYARHIKRRLSENAV